MIPRTSFRIRVFVVDAQAGFPLPGIPVAAVVEVVEDQQGQLISHPVTARILMSDHVGYLSFDLAYLVEASKAIRHIWIEPLHSLGSRVDALLGFRDANLGAVGLGRSFLIRLPVPRPTGPLRLPPIRLPSVPNPDLDDWKISPGSFGLDTGAVVGEGGCERILPSRVTERTYRFAQLVREVGAPTRSVRHNRHLARRARGTRSQQSASAAAPCSSTRSPGDRSGTRWVSYSTA